jgi:hypothetical protein
MTADRSITRAALDALGGLPLFLTSPLHRRGHLRWGATEAEVAGPMPGDDIVPKASFNATRAITVDAAPEMVWPWVVQMGYRRAGFYTYALADGRVDAVVVPWAKGELICRKRWGGQEEG